MTGYEAYCLYSAIMLHFTTKSYDIVKYNGKVGHLTVAKYEARNDRYYFHKLSRRYPTKDVLTDFLVANFIHSENPWVGDLLKPDAENVFLLHQSYLQSLSYRFESDCKLLFGDGSNPNNLLTCKSGEYPLLLTKAFHGDIHFNTLCILNLILSFLPMWKSKIDDDIRWPDYCRKIEKYSVFLPKDLAKYKIILKKVLG